MRPVPQIVAWTGVCILWVGAATFIAFLPSLANGFVNWDDFALIADNVHIRRLGVEQLQWMFTQSYMGPYQPLPWLTLAMDYQGWGSNPRGYHLTNLLWHIAGSIGFFVLARRLLQLAIPGSVQRPFLLTLAASFSAMLYSVHPLRVESVAWASERRDVLAGFFAVWAVWTYLKYVQAQQVPRPAWWWLLLSLACFLCAVLSKATVVGLPIVLSVLDVYPLHRFANTGKTCVLRPTLWVWIEKIPYWALSSAGAIVAAYSQHEARAMASFAQYGWIDRLALAGYSTVFYLRKTLLPVRLSPIYELSVTFSPWDVVYVFSALVALAITVLLLTYRKRFAGALAVWISYLALVAPVSGLAQTGYQIAADRYTYLPCMGFAILAGGMALGWALREHDGRRERAVLGLTLLSSVTLGCLTWRQCKVWRDSQTLWQHAVSLDPTSSRAHNNLGWAMAESARLGTARTHLSKAIQLRPGFADGHINLGVVLRRLRDPIGAMEQYRHAAATGARSADVAYNMAVLLAEEPLLIGLGYETAEDQLRAAADNYERCLALRPDHIRALYGLGIVYKRLGQLDRAKALYYRALRLEPTNVNARYNLAITLAADGDLAGADQQYRQVLSLNPHHVGACNNLANLLAQRGRSVEAVRLLSWGLVQSPGNVNLTYQLSWLLAAAPDANARDGPKAIALASQLPRRPHGEVPEHLDVLAAGYAESGRFDEAVVTASRALEAATKMQNTSLARAIAGRVELYRMRQPYRTSSSEP